MNYPSEYTVDIGPGVELGQGVIVGNANVVQSNYFLDENGTALFITENGDFFTQENS